MHPRAWLYVARVLGEHAAFLDRADVRVVEFGGAVRTDGYVLRSLLPWASWTSVDLDPVLDPASGSALHDVEQGDAATWGRPGMAEVVISTETLEHVTPKDGEAIVGNAHRLLVPGGLFVATMAGPTRSPHGATGDPHPAPDEHYSNVEPWQLLQWLSFADFGTCSIDLTDDRLDLRCVARV